MKKYKIIEVSKDGSTRFLIRAMIRREAARIVESLKLKTPDKSFVVQYDNGGQSNG